MINHLENFYLPFFSITQEGLHYKELYKKYKLQEIYGLLDCIQKKYYMIENRPQKFFHKIFIDYANRLKKNIKKLDKWANLECIECYRIYDRDLPNYRVAVDRYKDWIVIHDYAQPQEINHYQSLQHLLNIISTTINILKQSPHKIVIKTRTKKIKKIQQYHKISQNGIFFTVTELNVKLWVNLTDYIDTGIFLDHRIVRKILGKMSKGKDFLNLFSYTASASVYAGLGGARSTTTIDMSKTYISWATKNMLLNGLVGKQHQLLQSDCFHWLHNNTETFDLIFVHPPTFSNSKRMKKNFDIQRDHLELISYLKGILRVDGVLLFSNNKFGFKINLSGLNTLNLRAVEITSKTQPKDFRYNYNMHKCWMITHTD
ncbi:class I SAM-dependent methyltransferase [Candidatus Erwinia haradaeae]|uniref:Ribosomal RNA large subunit methyltransferase K/L, partial n=1 Tax=Candidatus Erwinia haradaeae TaxID=1922217 RepID=A0A451D2G2_9GAMM|nr:class I SAM-dependent methyltransferase [Candidatus Erwinia haradaeae]VFP79823.1 Ribosomal RNA large subunit methyltransferase K/L [Candidatus Erwinia haradaeae]